VLLANGLALSAQQAWDTPHNLRWQYLTSLYMQMPLEELQQLVHQNAASSARYHSMPDLWHPAQSLLWPWGVRRMHRGLLPAPPPSAESLVVWRKQCGQLLAEPSSFTNSMHLTTCARDALVACGMRRVLLLMADKTSTSLSVHQIAGLPKAAFDLSLQVNQSAVLQRLLEKPAQVRLNPENTHNSRCCCLLHCAPVSSASICCCAP
jgi:hypothetical protein